MYICLLVYIILLSDCQEKCYWEHCTNSDLHKAHGMDTATYIYTQLNVYVYVYIRNMCVHIHSCVHICNIASYCTYVQFGVCLHEYFTVSWFLLWLQFEKAHSPLLKDLMLYLKELMQDYRSDVTGQNDTAL